ncbi:MAG: FAD-binding protein, partial [Oscillospiraceae bacterium]|nr:FAD-binding protein [Oscillospiraceae bacterium]
MIDFNRLENICEKYGAEVLKNAPLAPFTTFKIGGPCDFLIRVPNREVLQKAVLFCKETDTPFYIIGNGSNVLVRDEGIRGVVLHTGWVWEQTSVDDDSGIIICTAGTELSSLCREARNASLTGLEFAYGIPGTTGGAIYMNAGAYDGEMSHVVYEVDYLNENGEFKTMLCKDTDFDYRKSPFT